MSLLLYPLRPPISIISTRVETLSNNRNLAKALPVLSLPLARSLSLSLSRCHSYGLYSGGGPHGSAGGSVDFIIRISDGQGCLPAREVRERELYYICGEKVQIDITPVEWVRVDDEATTTGGGAKKTS